MNTSYMFDNEWTHKYQELSSNDYEYYEKPRMFHIEKGFILPLKNKPGMSWGIGGVVDNKHNFIKESSVGINAFGGTYDFEDSEVNRIEDKVIFAGILPKHWGHFLTDTLSRLWFILENDSYKEYKIAFCKWGWENKHNIDGNYLEMFNYLGIDIDRIIMVDSIISAKDIRVPEPVMGYDIKYHQYYKNLAETICKNALLGTEGKYTRYDNIYFSRTRFFKSKLKEVGEAEIEECFEKANYKILFPETMTLQEQIYYINNCKRMAGLSGTITHNAIFGSKNMKLIILNRTCIANPPQIRINKLFNIDNIFVDVYSSEVEKAKREYGVGPIIVEVNYNLIRYFKEQEGCDISKYNVSRKAINRIHYYFLCLLEIVGNVSITRKIYNKYKSHSKRV